MTDSKVDLLANESLQFASAWCSCYMLVLPLSAALLLAFRSWTIKVQTMSRAVLRPQSPSEDVFRAVNSLKIGWFSALRIAAAPALAAAVVIAPIGLYRNQRTRVVNQAIIDARIHEENAEWDHAMDRYRKLIELQPSKMERRYRDAWVSLQAAETLIRTRRHEGLESLVGQLTKKASKSFDGVDRELRIRLMIVQAQMDAQAENHTEALNRLRHCRSIIAMRDRSNDSNSNRWLPAVETLQTQSLFRLGRFGDAARLFEHRAAGSAKPADQWTAAARAWRSDGNLPAVERSYRSAVAEVGYNSDLWLESVGLRKIRHGTRAAIQEIGLRQRLGGRTSFISDAILAQAWERVDDSDLAISHYRRAARETVQDGAALAIALARHGRSEEAVKVLSDPRWPASESLRAHTAAVVGVHVGVHSDDLSDASKAVLEAIMQGATTEASNDTTLLLAMVTWYSHCNNITAAKGLPERALIAQPGDVIAGNNLAESVGTWKLLEQRDLQPGDLAVLQASAHWQRVYQNQQTEQAIVATVIAGGAGALASHLPEACYARAEFCSLSDSTVWRVPDRGDRFRFQTLAPRNIDQPAVTIAYAWNDGIQRVAPNYPRIQLSGHTTLQRLLITMRHPSGRAPDARQAIEQFIELAVNPGKAKQARQSSLSNPVTKSY